MLCEDLSPCPLHLQERQLEEVNRKLKDKVLFDPRWVPPHNSLHAPRWPTSYRHLLSASGGRQLFHGHSKVLGIQIHGWRQSPPLASLSCERRLPWTNSADWVWALSLQELRTTWNHLLILCFYSFVGIINILAALKLPPQRAPLGRTTSWWAGFVEVTQQIRYHGQFISLRSRSQAHHSKPESILALCSTWFYLVSVSSVFPFPRLPLVSNLMKS